MDVYKKLDELGIKLMGPTPKGGIYSSVQPYGDHLLYVSGTAPHNAVDENMAGKLGAEYSILEGQEAARRCQSAARRRTGTACFGESPAF